MRALTYQPPGGIEALKYTTTFPTPTSEQLKPGEVLIKIVGAGLISAEITWETHVEKDGVYPAVVVCPDYSGTVDAVAEDVHDFKPGDEVMAVSTDFDMEKEVKRLQGGAAEYAIAPASWVSRIPKNVSVRDAASIPLCAFTAWQAFHDQADGQVKPGAEVLILGAGGATGLWAVQVAKLMGARVTVTASDPAGIKLLRDLGVDEVVNYKEQSLEAKGRKFDLVLDVVGGKPFDQGTKVVKLASDGGLLISLVEYEAQAQAPNGVAAKFFIWRPYKEQMAEIVDLVEAGKLRPIVDAYFPISQGIEAWKYASKGHCHGKVILEPQKVA